MSADTFHPSRRAFLQGRFPRGERGHEAGNDELHISSLLVQHRPQAMPALEAYVDTQPALEITARGEHRCVLLCETGHQREVLDLIDAMLALPGVVNVSLIYHHAEPRDELEQPLQPPPGAEA
ncbi:chaperone NapD [Dyella sp. 2RAB6]|uniref:chaperone NapD n=1 Tax=Dyella sp. 2RAB6 TaxID=3232992 RepID=UPI003F91EF6F